MALARKPDSAKSSTVAKGYQNFPARAFHQDQGEEPLDGTIGFTHRFMTFLGGETVIEIPLERLLTEFEEAGEGRILLRDSGKPDWTVVTLDMAVLECRHVRPIAQLAEQLESRFSRREISRRTKLVVLFFVICGAILWLGMVAVGLMVRSIVAKVPPAMEEAVGKESLDELKLELDFVEDSPAAENLAAIAKPLLDVLPRGQHWKFYIVEEKSPNAFALPGGHIVVTSGLLALADRPEEVLGVVAHELAHVMHKHGFRKQIASAGPILVFQIFLSGKSSGLAILGGGSALLVNQSFSQEFEKEADDAGWKYLVAANLDPRGMIEMFRKLQKAEAAQKNLALLPKVFASHPDVDKRIGLLEEKWKRVSRKSVFIQVTNAMNRD